MADAVGLWEIVYFCVTLVNTKDIVYPSKMKGPFRDNCLRAVGCIFAEMLNNSPLFPGESDIEQLCCVLKALGTPNEKMWPGMSSLPDYHKIVFPENPPIPFEQLLPDASSDALDLLGNFLVYPSKKRISAKQAILHTYFFMEPLPAHHSDLPLPQKSTKRVRRAHQVHEYSVDVPLEDVLVHPYVLRPHMQKRT